MQDIIHAVIFIAIIGVFLFFWWAGRRNKKNYKGQSMEITKDWYENSQAKYGEDDTKKAYFFSYDKNFLTQGHVMVDRDHKTIYEAKILYGDPLKGYETDLTNHLIDYKHHHNIGAAVTTEGAIEGAGFAINSYFKFDGVSIWDYIESLGYSYHFQVKGLAYQVNVDKNGEACGTIYSSNNGKNYFGCEGPIEPKVGGSGICVVECADRDMDAMFLLAMAFARTELSMKNLK